MFQLAMLHLADAFRVVTVAFGGFVVGGGFAILRERARYYGRNKLTVAVHCMQVLAVMNALVLTYVTLVLMDRWNEALSWRWGFAVLIFASKSYFFVLLRRVGVEQEMRAAMGSPGRRAGDPENLPAG